MRAAAHIVDQMLGARLVALGMAFTNFLAVVARGGMQLQTDAFAQTIGLAKVQPAGWQMRLEIGDN
jgi:hypothetical protein